MHASRENLPIATVGDSYEARIAVWDDYVACFERIRGGTDYGAYYETFEVPHWGYVFKGKLRFVYNEGDEVVSAGGAYYAPRGHKFEVLQDTETIEFSPTAEYKHHIETVTRNMQAASATAT